jgi:ribosomal protein L37AE/L43A
VSTPDSAVTDSSEVDPCPYCGTTTGVQPITSNPPKVQAWSCAACGTQWAVSVVNPRPWIDHLTAAVELAAARSLLRQIVDLASEAPRLSDTQLRTQLLALVGRLR